MERAGSRKETACQIYRDLVLENIEEDALIPNPRIDREQLDEIVDIPFAVPAGQTANRSVAAAAALAADHQQPAGLRKLLLHKNLPCRFAHSARRKLCEKTPLKP